MACRRTSPLSALTPWVSHGCPPHQVHRLLTSCFLHAGPLHLATSLLGLGRLVPPCAAIYGEAQAALLFLLSAAGGNLASLCLSSSSAPASVGASGAICGLEGAMLAYGMRNDPTNLRGAMAALMRSSVCCVAGSVNWL